MFPHTQGVHLYGNFSQLVDYSACYYTYLWSEVIAKDLRSVFQKHGVFDARTGERYRKAILQPGGSRDASDMLRDFLGRDFDFDAFRRWLDEARD